MPTSGTTDSKHLLRILLRFIYIVLSLTPSVVGPPEKNFTQGGQPELQQAMDNMFSEEEFMKKMLLYPSDDNSKVLPSTLTDKTSHLLEEAEHILSTTRDLKEKAWMQTLIQKLHHLTSKLEQDVANQTSDSGPQELTAHDAAQSMKKKSVPVTPALPETSSALPSTADHMTSKQSLTLPGNHQVKPVSPGADTAEHLVVTKPGMSSTEATKEDDELVRQLEELRNTSIFDLQNQSTETYEISSKPVEATTVGATREQVMQENLREIEREKERLKERMADEAAELKRLGESDEDIANALHIGNFQRVDPTRLNLETKQEEEEKISVGNEASMHETVKRVLDVEQEENVVKPDPNSWNLPAHQGTEAAKQIYMNNTFLGMHINLPQISPRLLRRQLQYGMYRSPMVRNFPQSHGDLKDTIQRLQAQNHQNFIMRNNMMNFPQGRSDMVGFNGMRPNVVPLGRYPPDNPALNRYPNFNNKPMYMPYPYYKNSVLNNPTSQGNQSKMKTDQTETLPGPGMNGEFSDEMKRQLRDGKVILLSDSVVRSNFPPNTEGETTTTEEPKKEN